MPVARSPAGPWPCRGCAKIPAGADPNPANAVSPSFRSRRIYEHYLECKSTGWRGPDADDPLVRRHAAIIRAIEEAVEVGRRFSLAAIGVVNRGDGHGD